MQIHKAIRVARNNAKLGVNDAANLLGTYGSTLSRMENGDAGIKAVMLVKMAELYQVSIDHLVSGEAIRQPSSLDLKMMGKVVQTIVEHVQQKRLTPTPVKLSKAVIQVYQAEANYMTDHPEAELDLKRHADLIDTIFEE